jgi:hypothetical protein
MSAGDAVAIQESSSRDVSSQSDGKPPIPTEKSRELSTLDSISSEQDGASNGTGVSTLKTPSFLNSPSITFGSQLSFQNATFVRQKNGWIPKEQHRLKNSLLASVGLLELGNAGDFAANVWNQIPIPHFAMALSTFPMFLGYTKP